MNMGNTGGPNMLLDLQWDIKLQGHRTTGLILGEPTHLLVTDICKGSF